MFSSQRRNRFRLTKTGYVFVLLIILLQLAAFNTGENLVYLVTSGVISFLVIGWWATGRGLRGLRLHRRAPDAVYREESFACVLRVEKDSRFWQATGVRFDSEGWEEPLWLDSVHPGASMEFRAYDRMRQRGLHPLPAVTATTTFPFGLVERRHVLDDRARILVYPRVYPLTKNFLDDLDDGGQTPKISIDDGDEFYSLREYVYGDDIRRMSWKISARMGRWIIRELEPSISRMVVLVLDTRGIPETDEDRDDLELAIELAASLAVSLLNLHYIVGLELPDASVEPGRGTGHGTKILEVLALAVPVGRSSYGDDWYTMTGNHAESSTVYLSTDPAQWGLMNPTGRGRVLNPREAIHG